MLLDLLMDNKQLKLWTIYQEPSGSTLVKIRFVDYQNGSDQHDQITKQNNSNMYFKRKSEKHIRRDKARAEQHKKATHAKMNTRSMAKEPNSDCKELPRFNLVESTMHGENLGHHMQYTHDISTISSPGASETSMISQTEHSLVTPEPHCESVDTISPEPEVYVNTINTPNLDGICSDDMNLYYDQNVSNNDKVSDVSIDNDDANTVDSHCSEIAGDSGDNEQDMTLTYVRPKSRNSEPPDKNFPQDDYLMKPDVDLTQSLDCIYSIV